MVFVVFGVVEVVGVFNGSVAKAVLTLFEDFAFFLTFASFVVLVAGNFFLPLILFLFVSFFTACVFSSFYCLSLSTFCCACSSCAVIFLLEIKFVVMPTDLFVDLKVVICN